MISISDKYSIRADEYNFMVIQHYVNKQGEPAEKVVGYVKDINHALEFICDRETKRWVRENDGTLKDVVKAFNDIKNELFEFEKKYDFPKDGNNEITETKANETVPKDNASCKLTGQKKTRGRKKKQ